MSVEPLRVWAGPLSGVDVNDRLERLALCPMVRAVLDDRLDDQARDERYGSLLTHYVLTEPDRAEVAVLPHAYEHAGMDALVSQVRMAEQHGLRTMVFSGDDLEPVMPSASVILLHPGPNRGAQPRADVLALPYLFTDRATPPEIRPDGDRPSVAFCGQGASRRGAGIGQGLQRALQDVSNRLRPRVIAPPVRGHVGLRSRALKALAGHPGVDDVFVIRDQYRAGVSSDEDRARTQAEFDDNLRAATYALCVRGTGNFSARFYEALSFGRVPLFVNTRCVLPFEDEIDWRARTVWVESSEASRIGERLVAAHGEVIDDPSRSAESLRQLWNDRLTQNGYFAHLPATVRRML